MSFTTGTATDHHDLMEQLKDYLLAEGWTINDWDLGATLTDPTTLIATGPGIMGGQPVHVSLQSEANSPTNAYAWKISCHPDYDSGLDFGFQLNNSPIKYFLLWPNAMDYWFYVNDRRFIVVAKIGSYYMSMYAGFFLPYALPEEYPFPYYIGASYSALQPYNYDDAGVRSLCDPGSLTCTYLIRETLVWRSLRNSDDSANDVDSYSLNDGAMTWPLRSPAVYGFTPNEPTDAAWSHLRLLRPLIGDAMPMWQVHLLDSLDRSLPGVLDGVFVTGGFNRSPEQIVTFDAVDYRLFIAANKGTTKHYLAIEEA